MNLMPKITPGWLTAIASLALAGAAVVTILYQSSNDDDTKRSGQAETTYQVQKDARELTSRLVTDYEFMTVIDGKITPDRKKQFLNHLWELLNMYRSIYRLHLQDKLTPEYTESLKTDFCGFVIIPAVRDGWSMLQQEGRIDDTHDAMRKAWCVKY